MQERLLCLALRKEAMCVETTFDLFISAAKHTEKCFRYTKRILAGRLQILGFLFF